MNYSIIWTRHWFGCLFELSLWSKSYFDLVQFSINNGVVTVHPNMSSCSFSWLLKYIDSMLYIYYVRINWLFRSFSLGHILTFDILLLHRISQLNTLNTAFCQKLFRLGINNAFCAARYSIPMSFCLFWFDLVRFGRLFTVPHESYLFSLINLMFCMWRVVVF